MLRLLLKQREEALRYQFHKPPDSNDIARGNTEYVIADNLEQLGSSTAFRTAPNQHSNDANIELSNEGKDHEQNSRRKRAKSAEDPSLQFSHAQESKRAKGGIRDGAEGTCNPARALTEDSQRPGPTRAAKPRRGLQIKTVPEAEQPEKKPVGPHID